MEEKDEELDIDKLTKKINRKSRINFEEFIDNNKVPLGLLLCGLILLGSGLFLYKQGYFTNSDKIEVIEDTTKSQEERKELVVEIAGAVEKPGVYKLTGGSRVEDLLVASGGISTDADRVWVEKVVNRAALLADGQKMYIPKKDENVSNTYSQSEGASAKNYGGNQSISGNVSGISEGLININSASQKLLEELPGIGPVYAQSIIEHRPYSSVEELLSKGALKKSVYEKVKEKVSVY